MQALLAALEGSGFGEWLRDSGVWTYGLINLGHIAGISALFGGVLILDLRLIGFRRSVTLAEVARLTVPVAAVGFVLAAVCGVCMICFNATEYTGNPFLLIKFPAIALALVNALVVSRMPAWRQKASREATAPEQRRLALAGVVSLVAWTAALAAGRMIGYW
jgi:integral membrane sensor domain MASE1